MLVKGLLFNRLRRGQHTWFEDARDAFHGVVAEELDGGGVIDVRYDTDGPVVRVNPGDFVPLDRFHRPGANEWVGLDVVADFVRRGVAEIADREVEETTAAEATAMDSDSEIGENDNG